MHYLLQLDYAALSKLVLTSSNKRTHISFRINQYQTPTDKNIDQTIPLPYRSINQVQAFASISIMCFILIIHCLLCVHFFLVIVEIFKLFSKYQCWIVYSEKNNCFCNVQIFQDSMNSGVCYCM